VTRSLPDRVKPVADYVVRTAANYLWNTIREPGLTCPVCSAPIGAGYPLCVSCSRHAASPHARADRVASLIYAVKPDTQAYKLVRNYKADAPGPSLLDTMSALLAIALLGHGACDAKLAGTSDIGWAVVPSTQNRVRAQPLRTLLLDLAKPGYEISLTPTAAVSEPRSLRPENFAVTAGQRAPDHVLVIDDSWVSGGHAQSVASALKSSGVADVSIFTVARVLDPQWLPNADFIKERLLGVFDPLICPWTGGDCP